MKRPGILFSCLLCFCTGIVPISAQDTPPNRQIYERGVVGIQVTYQKWDEDRPWAKQRVRSRSASAVLVDRSHLLTTADILDQATFMSLLTFGKPRESRLRITHIDPGINLALLEIEDVDLLDDLAPVSLADSTPVSGALRAVRWSGQQLESSASRVVRFLVERSLESRVEHAFLHMRTDLKSGGWSEPVFHDGKLVGITVSQSGQTSRAIPVEIIQKYLEQVNDKEPYLGFPALGVLWQTNSDTSVTRFLGQKGRPRGILLRQVPWGSSGCGVLKPRDILLSVDGHAIDAKGFYRHPYLGQLMFAHLLAEHHLPGDSIPVRVLRAGREQNLQMALRSYPAALDAIPTRRYNSPPPYIIAGGLVVRELDVPYLKTWGKEWSKNAPTSLLTRYYLHNRAQTPEKRRVVLITRVLPSDYNIGYQDLRDEVIEKINGQPIGSILDVGTALRFPRDGFHVFDLAPGSTPRQVVLNAMTFETVTNEILITYSIPQAVRLPDGPLPEGGGSCAGDY